MSLGENALDSLLDQGKASDAIELLQRSSSGLELTNARVTKLLDAACAASADGMAGAVDGAALMEQQANSQQAAMDFQIKQQNDLLACYKLLADKGVLRGFGVASTLDALPAPEPRVMLPDDQQRLTGLPTSAFAPPRGERRFARRRRTLGRGPLRPVGAPRGGLPRPRRSFRGGPPRRPYSAPRLRV